MTGEFTVMINGELVTYTNYNDIPDTFEHVIKYAPDWPEPPHTQEDHDYMETFNNKLQRLMEIENASSN
tara:strand:+ start:223 stop:429 length:207 start_codon:yes stop_codon:yes gene_type:complete